MNDRRFSEFRIGIRALAVALGLAVAARDGPDRAGRAGDALTLRHAAELALAPAPQLAATRAARDEGGASRASSPTPCTLPSGSRPRPAYSSGLPVLVAGSVPAYGAIVVRQTIWDPERRTTLWRPRPKWPTSRGPWERLLGDRARPP